MKRSLATTLATAVAAPLALTAVVAGAAPAQAQSIPPANVQSCADQYVLGPYNFAALPVSATVAKGATVKLTPLLIRGEGNNIRGCNNRTFRFWSATALQDAYRPGAYQVTMRTTDPAVTNPQLGFADGYAIRNVGNVTVSFRWFVQFTNRASKSAGVTVR